MEVNGSKSLRIKQMSPIELHHKESRMVSYNLKCTAHIANAKLTDALIKYW